MPRLRTGIQAVFDDLIANERGKFDLPGFLRQFPFPQTLITAITAAELLHGVERAQDPGRRARRQQQVEQILASISVQPFDLTQARCPSIKFGVPLGEHLDHQVWGASRSGFRQVAKPVVGEEEKVGLNDVDVAEVNVEGREI